ncbi:MurR/RpiR family transcriptional regulator [bacterium]|nr:MurR/RpiR family transcriptional regulator [bacterium]
MNDFKKKFFASITESTSRFTTSDNAIADHLVRTYPNCMLRNASELAQELNLNVSTVTRFFQKIGYDSIKTAQRDFKKDIDLQANSARINLREENRIDAKESIVGAYLISDIANIEATFDDLSIEKLDILNGLFSDRKNTITIGSNRGQTYAMAYYLYSNLKQVRPHVKLLKPDPLDIADDLVSTLVHDVLVMFDFRRYAEFNYKIAKTFKQRGGRIAVLSDSPISPIGKIADLVFEIKTKSPSGFDSYAAAITLINLIIGVVSRSWEDFMFNNAETLDKLHGDLKIFS